MEITPENKPGSSLFHTIDRQFKSDVIVNFQFHPEHASEAKNLIAGLVPFLKDSGHAYHLKMFTPEAIQRQVKSRWDAEKREAHSEADIELQNLLAKDDDLNFTNERTLEIETPKTDKDQDPVVSVHVPDFPPEHMPSMRHEDDSVSTFIMVELSISLKMWMKMKMPTKRSRSSLKSTPQLVFCAPQKI
jgi:hypothetical protein